MSAMGVSWFLESGDEIRLGILPGTHLVTKRLLLHLHVSGSSKHDLE
jgi:hypothetical protein